MDFIERIFGIAPDNGSGGIELLLLVLPFALLAYGALRRPRASRRDSSPRP